MHKSAYSGLGTQHSGLSVIHAASLGAHAVRARTLDDLKTALLEAKKNIRTCIVVIEVDPEVRVPGYESWWDVAIAEVSESESVRKVRAEYERAVKRERNFL